MEKHTVVGVDIAKSVFEVALSNERVLPQVRVLIEDAGSDIPAGLRAVLATACDQIQGWERASR